MRHAYLVLAFCVAGVAESAEGQPVRILPAFRASEGDTVSVVEGKPLAMRPPVLQSAKASQWQVRIIRATKEELRRSAVPKDSQLADSCVEFGAYWFTMSPPVGDRVLVSLIPHDDWLKNDSLGNLVESHYVVVIEERLAGEPNGKWAPLAIPRGSIEDYLRFAAEMTVIPAGPKKRVLTPGSGAAPASLRAPCLKVQLKTSVIGLPTLMAAGNLPSLQSCGLE